MDLRSPAPVAAIGRPAKTNPAATLHKRVLGTLTLTAGLLSLAGVRTLDRRHP